MSPAPLSRCRGEAEVTEGSRRAPRHKLPSRRDGSDAAHAHEPMRSCLSGQESHGNKHKGTETSWLWEGRVATCAVPSPRQEGGSQGETVAPGGPGSSFNAQTTTERSWGIDDWNAPPSKQRRGEGGRPGRQSFPSRQVHPGPPKNT